MMFKNDFVASIRCNGRILHEDRSEGSPIVYLPFNSEYSIILKNLYSTKALVSVFIDGTDVLFGKQLIINPNDKTELSRFVENFNYGNSFKFIEKTDKISNFRGDKVDDGIIRIEYQFEQLPSTITYVTNYPNNAPWYNTCYSDSVLPFTTNTRSTLCSNSVNDSGITTRGSENHQKFEHGTIGYLENAKHVINLQLRGKINNNSIKEIIDSRQKNHCEVCGTNFKISYNYCPNCGTHKNVICN